MGSSRRIRRTSSQEAARDRPRAVEIILLLATDPCGPIPGSDRLRKHPTSKLLVHLHDCLREGVRNLVRVESDSTSASARSRYLLEPRLGNPIENGRQGIERELGACLVRRLRCFPERGESGANSFVLFGPRMDLLCAP